MLFKKLKSILFVNFTHFSALCRRYVALIFADKMSLCTLIFQAPVMVIIMSLACSSKFGYYEATVTMFIVSCVCVIMATLNSYLEICKEREILIRETNAGLDSTAYVLSKVFIQGIICLFQALVLVIGTALFIDFNISSFGSYLNYFFFTFLILLTSTCIGLFISALLKNSNSAILPVLFIIIAQVVLSGAIITLPKEFDWLHFFAISSFALGGYSHIFDFPGLAKQIEEASVLIGNPVTVHVKDIFLQSYSSCVLVMIGISILCITLTILLVRKLRKKKF